MFSVQYTGLAEIAGTGAQRCAQDARDERLTGLIETVLGAWICGLHLILSRYAKLSERNSRLKNQQYEFSPMPITRC